jgi:hypothetical protein
MTTWKLKLTPPGGPITEKHGLNEQQALEALADLMYGRFDDEDVVELPRRAERDATPLAA